MGQISFILPNVMDDCAPYLKLATQNNFDISCTPHVSRTKFVHYHMLYVN